MNNAMAPWSWLISVQCRYQKSELIPHVNKQFQGVLTLKAFKYVRLQLTF
jgi:hypothetical protein